MKWAALTPQKIRQDLQLDVCSQVRRGEILTFSKMPPTHAVVLS